ncbi:MAG: type II toxin-antitoxin system death-on-curing family toxin [Gemmatimonadaceae bacterium]
MTRVMIDAIHEAQLREHGGSPGIREQGLIESAINRPRNKWAYGEDDPAVLAGAYAFGVARNDPYIDGNKRVAFMVAAVFLSFNGIDVETTEPEVVDMITRLAAGQLGERALAAWLRSRMR